MKTKAKAPPSSYKPKNFHLDKRAGTLLEVEAKADDEELIDTKALSAWIGTTAQWLTIARSGGYGPPFVRVAPRQIMYRRGAIRAWLKERTFHSTKEYGP